MLDIRTEGHKAGIEVKEIRIGEPAIPPELLISRIRVQLADQLSKAYERESAAQAKRTETEKAKATEARERAMEHLRHADRLATIREVYEKTGSLIDTHTADAVKVARPLVKSGVPMIVLETALPVKFADTVKQAVGFEPPLTADQQAMMTLPLRVVQIAPDVERVKAIIAGR